LICIRDLLQALFVELLLELQEPARQLEARVSV
jgi:hypothetical protein